MPVLSLLQQRHEESGTLNGVFKTKTEALNSRDSMCEGCAVRQGDVYF